MADEKMILATDSMGGYSVHQKLSNMVFHAAKPILKFRQFTQLKEAFGKNVGDAVLINKWTAIDTAGGALTEGTNMTYNAATLSQVTITVTEFGNAIDYSSKLRDLSNHDVQKEIATVLARDSAKTMDTRIEAVFNAAKIRYVGTTTAGSALTTNGTATATNTSVLNAFHVKEIVYYLRSNDVPTYTANDFICIGTTKALRGLKDNSSWENAALYGATERLFNGEVGKYYGCRFVEQNNGMDTTIGSGSTTGEAYFFGGDVCAEVLTLPLEVRREVPADFGRRLAMAWYMIAQWGLVNDTYIIKWDSA